MQPDIFRARNLKLVIFYIPILWLLEIRGIIAQDADIILINGNIFTADTSQRYVQAIAIKGNKILATGQNEDIIRHLANRTKKIDLGGATVVPGFNNAHDHPMFLAPIGKYFTDEAISIRGLLMKQVSDSISRLVSSARPGEWISGPIGMAILNDTSVRATLDSLAPVNPVYLQTWWGHGSVANKAALNAAGIKDSDSDPSGGWYIRNSRSEIAALHENAQAPLWTAHPLSSPLTASHSLINYGRQQIEHGITSVQYMGTGIDPEDPSKFFKSLAQTQRVRLVKWASCKTFRSQKDRWKFPRPERNQLFHISGMKYLIDGTPIEGNAFRRLLPSGHQGRLNYPIDTLRQIIKAARDGDDQLILHAVGDSAVALTVAIMKELAFPDLWRKKRVRIEHNSVIAPSRQLVADLRLMGILLMHTPKYGHASSLKSLIEAGVLVGIAPDGSMNPFTDIAHIASCQDSDFENISREQAVIAYTFINAFAEYEEETKGRLMPGMLADLAVLTNNVFTVPGDQLEDTRSRLTMVNGRIVYGGENWK